MPKRVNPDFLLVGIGGSVSMMVRDRIYAAAKREGVSPSGFIGHVMTEFANGLPPLQMEADPRQQKLFSKLDTAGELLEQRRAESEPPKEIVRFGEGHKVTEGVLTKKPVKVNKRVERLKA